MDFALPVAMQHVAAMQKNRQIKNRFQTICYSKFVNEISKRLNFTGRKIGKEICMFKI